MAEQPTRPHSLTDIPPAQLPESIRADARVHDALQRSLEEGRELNQAQVTLVLNCVRYCVQARIPVSPAYAAATLLDFRSQATLSAGDQTLRDKLEKQDRIRELADRISSLRETRVQQETARLTASVNGRLPTTAVPDPALCIGRMKQALAQRNFDHAVEIGSQAASAYSRFPEILFTAGICYLRRAAYGQESDVFLKVQDLKNAVRLLAECLTIANDPKRPYFAKWTQLASGPLAQAQSALLKFEAQAREQEERYRNAEKAREAQERRTGQKKRTGGEKRPPTR